MAKQELTKIDIVRKLMGMKSSQKKGRQAMLTLIKSKANISTNGMASRYYHQVKSELAQVKSKLASAA